MAFSGIPLPRTVADVGPGGPLVTGLNALNNLDVNRSAAQYAPYTNYANAASKIAYSNFVGPQAIASILTNPATRGMFTPQQYNDLAKAFSSQVSGSGNALANLPPPGSSGSIGGQLINKLMSIFNLPQQSSQPQNALVQPQMPNMNPAQSNANAGMNYDRNGNNVVASPDEIQNAVNRGQNTGAPVSPGGSPTYQRLSKNIPQGTYGAESPSAITAAGEKGLNAQTETEAKNIANQWQARQDDIKDQAAGAQEVLNNADRMEQSYPELQRIEKGFGLGSFPAVSGNAQEFDQAATNMYINKIKQWQSSRITNMDLKVGPLQKPGRYMNDAEFNKSLNYERGLSQRTLEYPSAALKAQEMGLSPAQFDAVWTRYANERPFFNAKTGKKNENNLNSWEDYLTPDSLKETFSPKFKKEMSKYKENMAGGDKTEDKKIHDISGLPEGKIEKQKTMNGKIYVKIDGKWHEY